MEDEDLNNYLNYLNKIEENLNIKNTNNMINVNNLDCFKEYNEYIQNENNNLVSYINNLSDEQKLSLKNYKFKKYISQEDKGKHLIAIKKSDGVFNYNMKIIKVKNKKFYVRNNNKIFRLFSNDYYLFVKPVLSFREYLEEFLK